MDFKQRFLEKAKYLSQFSDHPKHKLGCVIVHKNRIISEGFNKTKTHSFSSHKWKRIHAEIDALLKIRNKDYSNLTIYIYREIKSGEPALARPCPTCLESIKSFGIKRIIYTCNTGIKMEFVC